MKLLLTVIESTCWKGVVEIEEELFKVTLFPGDINTDWKVILQATCFVELTKDGEIEKAISRAHHELIDQAVIKPDSEKILLEALDGNQQVFYKVKAILSKARKGENHEGDDKTG